MFMGWFVSFFNVLVFRGLLVTFRSSFFNFYPRLALGTASVTAPLWSRATRTPLSFEK